MKKLWIGALLVLGLVAVVVLAPGGQRWLEGRRLYADEQRLLNRVGAYWQGRVDADVETMAKYHHPLQTGLAKPGALTTESYELHEVEIDGDEATAALTIRTRLNLPGFSRQARDVRVESKWVRYEGEWYQALRPTNIGEMLRGVQQRMHPEAFGNEPVTPPDEHGEEVVPDNSSTN